jgi:serine/threonine-protein kinase HipA
MALKLNGKDDNLRRADFVTLATTAGVRVSDAETAIDDVLNELRKRIDGIAVPHAVEVPDSIRKLAAEALTICRQRIDGLA